MTRFKSTWIWILSFVVLLGGIALGLFVASNFTVTSGSRASQSKNASEASAKSAGNTANPKSPGDGIPSFNTFAAVAEKVIPSVVSINCTKFYSGPGLDNAKSAEEMRDYYGGRNYNFRIPQEYRQDGSGSGVIISPEGYIITNMHVVNMAQDIKVVLADNRSFAAMIVGMDPLTEVAVIKIDGKDLPFATLGQSDSCKVGDWVLAIGNPLDLRSTVTAGIISAKGRQIDIINDNFAVESFIQTDAAINPGNSGGALVNLQGEVIGINTAIATETGLGIGYGFAIPINLVRKISIDLIRKGKVVRGYLGIAMQNIDELQARALHLPAPEGVFVDDVFKDSPAERADIRPMDIILAIDGEAVNRTNQLQALIAKKDPGTKVEFHIIRDGVATKKAATLGVKESIQTTPSTQKKIRKFKNLGIEVQKLAEVDRLELGYSGSDGVLITGLQRSSPAERKGLQIDDVITRVNKTIIHLPDDFYREMDKLQTGDVVIVVVARSGGSFHYFIEVY